MPNYARSWITWARELVAPRTPGRHTAAHLHKQQHNSASQHHSTATPPDAVHPAHPVDRGALVRPYVLAHAQRRAAALASLHTCGARVVR